MTQPRRLDMGKGRISPWLIIVTVVCSLSAATLSAGEASYYVWVEGEDASRNNMLVYKWKDKGCFSQDCTLRTHWGGEVKPGMPTGGYYFAEYDIEIPEDGTYNIWFHGSTQMQMWRSRCQWSIDGGPLHDRIDYTSFASCAAQGGGWPNSAAWTKLGKVKLSGGKYKFLLKALPREDNGTYLAFFDCIVFVNTRYSTWKPDITPEADGIQKPPEKPSQEGFDFFVDSPSGGHGILQVDFTKAKSWTPVNLLLQREETFDSIPDNLQIMMNTAQVPGTTKLWVLFADATGEEFAVLLTSTFLINRWAHFQISPSKLIKEYEFAAQGGNANATVDLPLKFKGIRIIARNPKKEKISFDNLIIAGRLVEDFEDMSDWKVSAGANTLEPILYSSSRKTEEWAKFFVQVDTIYLASDLTSLVPFEYDAEVSYGPTQVYLQLDLPPGIHIASKPITIQWAGQEVPAIKELGKATHEDEEYTRYRVVCRPHRTGWTKLDEYPPLNLYLSTDLKAGAKTKIFHRTFWRHGEEQKEGKEIANPVEVIEVKETTPPERFVTGVWSAGITPDKTLVPSDFYLKFGLANVYRYAGFPPDVIQELKKAGYQHVVGQVMQDIRNAGHFDMACT